MSNQKMAADAAPKPTGESGKKFGEYIKVPQFADTKSLRTSISKLPKIEKVGLMIMGVEKLNAQLIEIPNRYALVNQKNRGQVFGLVSGKYSLSQHDEALQPLVDGLGEIGVQFKGSFYTDVPIDDDPEAFTPEGGRIKGVIVLDGPDYVVKIGKDETVNVALRVGNSVDGSMRRFIEGAAVTSDGRNYLLLGDVLGRHAAKHIGASAKATTETVKQIQKIKDNAAKLPELFKSAFETPLDKEQIQDVMLGIWYSWEASEEVSKNLEKYLTGPQLKQYKSVGPNLKSVYDACTNYFTHHYPGTIGRSEWALQQATQLLTTDIEMILALATKRRSEKDSKQKVRADRKAAKIAARETERQKRKEEKLAAKKAKKEKNKA